MKVLPAGQHELKKGREPHSLISEEKFTSSLLLHVSYVGQQTLCFPHGEILLVCVLVAQEGGMLINKIFSTFQIDL